jgi:hypothetical protein
MQIQNTLSCACIAALALIGSAQAASITSAGAITGSQKVITFDQWDGLVTTGPVDVGAEVGADVLFTSVPNSILGANQQDLGDNGLWGARGNPVDGLEPTPTGSGNFLASAFITRRGEFGFTFANPVSAVGAYFNQFQALGSTSNRMVLIAYDADGNELESYTQSVDTDAFGYNEGSFFGIQRAHADIFGFGIADGTVVMDNLTFAVPVPEPSSYALLLAGLGVVAWSISRQSRR